MRSAAPWGSGPGHADQQLTRLIEGPPLLGEE